MQALASEPGALFVEKGPISANATADLAVKIREDPLFLIKQKEVEAKKRLASNPIKLKRLQQVGFLAGLGFSVTSAVLSLAVRCRREEEELQKEKEAQT